ncbi:DUF4123 domain-containing protein [Burkholderia oklahomensis]|uniref:DUF4123 domain-containing protein n=1 Tax=Burkholderia oklahomensis TaxID=342113 RepID=A0AAI8FPW1_9BURK|nr:DUF4123 domain-containing protein [Burkholderia oklahomensis]AIO68247.1 hypothetical protein DM82_881 [Burkholderia oklahomensis]AOI42795.1 hypothetical protein WG70_24920 [Burkholderia oklahomensis EO147]KUY54537.1 hypothetical protein WG70_12735 [Burkholderia oklahomensis EO147]QPS37541.1 DUF4123 domain-containing protein [Burkholderia oklahomensis]
MTTETFDWIDPYPADALPRLRQVLDAPSTEGRWYALLDMGFSPLLRDALAVLNPNGAVVALYEGVYDGEGLMEISPCLMSLPDDAQPREEVCAALLRETDGRPMLSLLRAAHGIDALVAHLRGQMEARAEDDEAFLVRLADTRCVPTWAGVLTPAQRNRFFAGIDAWWLFDRTASLVELDVAPVGIEIASDDGGDGEPYRLDADQIAALRQASKIDTLIFHVRQRPESFGRLTATPSQAHACVSEVWAKETTSPSVAARAALDALEAAGWLVPVAVSA